MSNVYHRFGTELSLYSVKVPSYCRYNSIPLLGDAGCRGWLERRLDGGAR